MSASSKDPLLFLCCVLLVLVSAGCKGSEESFHCITNADCESGRCCTDNAICDFDELDNKFTCRG